MKVLFISAGDDKYGAPKSLFELMQELKENYEVEPVLLTKKYNLLNKKCAEIGIENYSMWYADIMAGASYNSKLIRFVKHVVKYSLFLLGKISQFRIKRCGIDFSSIDLVHTNLNVIGIGAEISKYYNIPHVWHLRVFGEEDYNVVCYKHNCYRYMNNNANKFIAISKGVCDAWIKKGIDSAKIQVVYNGIDPSLFLKKEWKKTDRLKIVMVGHIQPKKGQLQLIKAIKLLPEELKDKITVDFIGEPYKEYYSELKRNLCDSKIEENFRFLGYVDNLPRKLKEYDIGINCSMAEGFGRITVEYMAAKLLVIASDTGANPEIIANKENGLLYEYGNCDDLSEKIQFAYFNRAAMEAMAEKGLRTVHEKFTIHKTAEEVSKIYMNVLDS